MQIKKAVFPVAGLGTRFLPVTKANPKEMLPIVDKPLIQYAVEEAIRAGIHHMIFVTSSSKRAIEDHFDQHFELETRLQEQGKDTLLTLVKNISPPDVQFTYVRQNQPLGLGHAILAAEHVVEHEPFAVLLADDLIDDAHIPCLTAMTEHYERTNRSIIAVQQVTSAMIHQYGIVDVEDVRSTYSTIRSMIEKPPRHKAPSNLASIGRYIFTSKIFNYLKKIGINDVGEIQLTEGIRRMLSHEPIDTYQFQGKRYDCGSKIGYLQATIEMGLHHPEVGEELQAYLQRRLIKDDKHDRYSNADAISRFSVY